MPTTHSMYALALVGAVLGGCATSHIAPEPIGPKDGPGALALTVHYGSLCETPTGNDICETISYPEVCWMGSCTDHCGGQGEREFKVCAPGGTRSDDPYVIDQTVSQMTLLPGDWKVKAFGPKWKVECRVQVLGGMQSTAKIDSAEQTCI